MNSHNYNSALKLAVQNLRKCQNEPANVLPKRLKEVATRGIPTNFTFRQYNIRYCTRDETGIFKLHWIVTNGISGNQKYFYSRDWINPTTGNLRWTNLSAAMKKV